MKRLIYSIFSILLLFGCSDSKQVYTRQVLSFGTQIDVTLFGVKPSKADEAIQEIETQLDVMHSQWHAWQKSTLTDLNDKLRKGEPFEVNPTLLPLILQSQQLYTQSNGLFNPAIGKLIELWGFYKDNPEDNQSIPSKEDIDSLLKSNPNMMDIRISGTELTGFNQDLQIDFGGYAKGFGVDRLVELLKAQGINNALINAGGDIRGIGFVGDRPWRIAIQHPIKDKTLGWIELEDDESIFTSGDYRRKYSVDGKQYHHIIDPRTGYPSEHAHSVTVIHPSGAIADAAATALMVAKPSEWFDIARRIGLNHLLVVDKDGQLYSDQLFAERIVLIDHSQIINNLGSL